MEIISFVILHYKDMSVTDKCVESILSMNSQEGIRIVIVDNDLQEQEEQRRKNHLHYREKENISILYIKENGGFSYANNVGYQYAREVLNASFIIVLNNDIEFTQKDFPERMTRIYKYTSCHILGPDIVKSSTNEHQNPMDQRVRTRKEAEYTIKMNQFALRFYPLMYPVLYWKLKKDESMRLRKKEENSSYYEAQQQQIVPFGACLIFTPLFVEREEKAFSPETKFFYEEYLLAHRCLKKGYRIVYDPDLLVMHESGAATKKDYRSGKSRIRFMMQRTLEACKIYKKEIEDNKNE